jgi:integrase
MDHVSRLHRKKTIPEAFTIDEVQDVRAAIKAWESRRILARPRLDRQLGQIVEVMLGTSARSGEVLAIRPQDLDLDGPISTVRIVGTIITRKGQPTHRQDHPKTDRALRRVVLPPFALRVIRSRLLRTGETDLGALLFSTRVGTPYATNNIRRLLGDVMDEAGIERTSPRTASAAPSSKTPRAHFSPPNLSDTPAHGSRCSTTSSATRPYITSRHRRAP